MSVLTGCPSDLGTLLESGFDAVFHIGDYEIHLWRRWHEDGWSAMVCWFGNGIALAEASGATPAEALWNVSGPGDGATSYSGDFAGVPARLVKLTRDLETAAVARAQEQDRTAGLVPGA